MHLFSLNPLVWFIYLLAFFEGLGTGAFIASFSTRAEPQITPPPAVKILNVRNDSQGQNFIGYYYFDGSWQTTDCGTQTFGVSSLLGYCCTTGTSCDHPTACSSGYVLGPQGPFVCGGSGYTCGSAFLAPSFGAQPVTTFIQCYPSDWILTSWYRIKDSQAESTSSSSTSFSITDFLSTLSTSTSTVTLAGSPTTQTPSVFTSSTSSPADPFQQPSEKASIAGAVVGSVFGFAALVLAIIFGINQWRKRR